MKKLILYLCLFQLFTLRAQKGFLSGYVVTNQGDTIRGVIRDRKYVSGVNSWQKISFIDTAGKHYTFDPEDLREYKRNGRPRYITLVIGVEQKKTFLEVSEEGPVMLLSYYRGTWGSAGNAVTIGAKKKESKIRTNFYLAVNGLPVYSTNDQGSKAECFLQFRNKPASLMQWRPRDYKTTAKVFFKDNEEIMKLIEDDALDEDDIFAIVKKYDQEKNSK